MGNKNNNQSVINPFRPNQWIEIPQSLSNIYTQYGKYKTFTHIFTDQKIDKYQMTFNSSFQYKQYLQVYSWRMREPNMVTTLYIKQNNIEDVCSTIYKADVFIQHIPVRLDGIKDIQYPDNLYFLSSALEGYSRLYHNFPLGYFLVNQNQICIDEEGIVKVWINSDLSKNYPQPSEYDTEVNEQLMVSEIIKLIDDNTDHQTQPVSFPIYLQQKGLTHLTFQMAKRQLGIYTNFHDVKIPREVKSIVNDCMEREVESFVKEYQHKQQDNIIIKGQSPVNLTSIHQNQHLSMKRYHLNKNSTFPPKEKPIIYQSTYQNQHKNIKKNRVNSLQINNKTNQFKVHFNQPLNRQIVINKEENRKINNNFIIPNGFNQIRRKQYERQRNGIVIKKDIIPFQNNNKVMAKERQNYQIPIFFRNNAFGNPKPILNRNSSNLETNQSFIQFHRPLSQQISYPMQNHTNNLNVSFKVMKKNQSQSNSTNNIRIFFPERASVQSYNKSNTLNLSPLQSPPIAFKMLRKRRGNPEEVINPKPSINQQQFKYSSKQKNHHLVSKGFACKKVTSIQSVIPDFKQKVSFKYFEEVQKLKNDQKSQNGLINEKSLIKRKISQDQQTKLKSKVTYYTKTNQHQLDPQIAADLMRYS